MVDTTIDLGSVRLKSPVIAASGTFGFGREVSSVYDLSQIGGICTKGLTVDSRSGNPPPRVAETASGMLNSVGLQNPGIDSFIRDELPNMLQMGCRIVVNIAGNSLEDYQILCRTLDTTRADVIELNLSCPNVREGCMMIGSDERQIKQVVSASKAMTTKPLWVKLTPNVTDIVRMACAAEEAGADAVVLINTLMGLAIDRTSRRPILHNNTGGLSGPAIKPVALRMVADVFRSVSIPIVGVGGIMNGSDAIEFLIAGASAVEIGTATLLKPSACLDVQNEMIAIAESDGVDSLKDYSGTLIAW